MHMYTYRGILFHVSLLFRPFRHAGKLLYWRFRGEGWTLKGIRTDEAFELFFQLVECFYNHTDTEEPSLPRKRKTPK